MAEIRRLQSEGVFNKPIGVVTPSTAGVQAGQQMANLGKQIFETAFANEVTAQKKIGQQAAQGFAVRDADQKIQFRRLPDGLSKVAQAEAQPLIDKKYQAAILSDMKKKAAMLRADHPNDPDGFDNAFSTYVQETAKLNGRYSSFTLDVGGELSGENYAALYADKVDAEDAALFKDTYSAIVDKADDLAARIEGGQIVSDSSIATAELNSLYREIDALVDEHGDRLSVTGAPELRKAIKRKVFGSMANQVANKLQTLPQFQNPANGAELAASVLNGMEQAYRTGSLDGIEPSVVKAMADAGFKEMMIDPDLIDAESRRIIAGDISVLENNMQERLTATKNSRLAMASVATINNGGIVSGKDMDNVFNQYGYTSAESLFNDLPNILNPANAETKPIRDMLLHNNSDLPKVVRDLFSADNLERFANSQQMPMILDLFQQTTRRMNNDGSGQNTVSRGIADETMVTLEALNAYRNGVKSVSFEEYFQRRNELARDPNRGTLLNAKLGKNGDKQVTMSDFISNSIGSDVSADERNFYMQYAEDLVLMHGKDMAADILKQSANKVFVKSEFMTGEARSRFAPEKAFPLKSDLMVFKEHTQKLLDTVGSNYKLGKNAFLIADRRHGMVNPVYLVVDENNMPIMNGTEPILASGQAVIERRLKMRNQSLAEAREDMRKEYQRRLQYEAGTSGALKDPSLEGGVTDYLKKQLEVPQ